MARARNIKPGFFQNDTLAECSVWARLLFAGLWTLADRDGKLEDRPVRIKAALLPYDNQNVDKLLSELHNRGFIYRYSANGCKSILIINFRKHQNPHSKEPASTIPDPDGPPCLDRQEPGKTGARTGLEPEPHGSGPADSLNLIPPSLNPHPDSLKPGSGTGTEPLPFSSSAFAEAWARWTQHRRETRKPVTPTSARQQFKKLAEIGEARAIQAIDHSIANGYQGIFEPTTRGTNHANPAKRTGTASFDAARHTLTPLDHTGTAGGNSAERSGASEAAG